MSDNVKTPSPQKKEGTVVTKAQITAVTSQTYQGPIPPASEMQKYAAINPELPMRIMAMAEKQSAHRQEIEKIAVAESFKQKSVQTLSRLLRTTLHINFTPGHSLARFRFLRSALDEGKLYRL